MSTPPLILASVSPRRAALLRELELDFTVVPSEVPEVEPHYLTPREAGLYNAYQKARAVAKRHPDALVLGADTVVCLGTRLFGKPSSLEEAAAFLQQLQGCRHEVITGVCLLHWRSRRQWLGAEITGVWIKPLTGAQIADYLGRINPLDKAGGYAIQEHGDLIIERIEGSYSNVVGLPLECVQAALRHFGFGVSESAL